MRIYKRLERQRYILDAQTDSIGHMLRGVVNIMSVCIHVKPLYKQQIIEIHLGSCV